ncbi:hypothetical protein V1291_000954 [Nitrobacteraceae bacterium AZCC 1564]
MIVANASSTISKPYRLPNGNFAFTIPVECNADYR